MRCILALESCHHKLGTLHTATQELELPLRHFSLSRSDTPPVQAQTPALEVILLEALQGVATEAVVHLELAKRNFLPPQTRLMDILVLEVVVLETVLAVEAEASQRGQHKAPQEVARDALEEGSGVSRLFQDW